MRRRTHRRTSLRRGFTTVEVVVASFLAIVLGVAVASALDTTSRATKASLLRASAQREVREISDEFTQYVRSAQPPMRCEDPSTAQNFADCVVLLRDGAAFLEASPDRVVFFTRTEAITGPGDPLALVTMTVERSERGAKLIIEEQTCSRTDVLLCRNASDYGPRRLLRTLTLSTRPPSEAPASVFGFLGADGRNLCQSRCPEGTLPDIAVVRFDPSVELDLESGAFRVGQPVLIAVSTGGPDAG